MGWRIGKSLMTFQLSNSSVMSKIVLSAWPASL